MCACGHEHSAVPAPCPGSAHCHQTTSTPAVPVRRGSRTSPAPRRSTGRRKVQRPQDAGPGRGGLSRGSAEVGVGTAPRGSEGRGEAKSQADPRDATRDPACIPPLLQATRRGREPVGLPGLGAHLGQRQGQLPHGRGQEFGQGWAVQRRPHCPVLSCPSEVAGKPARQAEPRSRPPGLCWGPTRAAMCESSVAHNERPFVPPSLPEMPGVHLPKLQTSRSRSKNTVALN